MLEKSLRFRWCVLVVVVVRDRLEHSAQPIGAARLCSAECGRIGIRGSGGSSARRKHAGDAGDDRSRRRHREPSVEGVRTVADDRRHAQRRRHQSRRHCSCDWSDSRERTFSFSRLLERLACRAIPARHFAATSRNARRWRRSASDSKSSCGPAAFGAQSDVAAARSSGRYRFCDHRSRRRSVARVQHELREKAKHIPGLVDVYSTLQIDNPELLANIDRERAAAMGVEVREIADTLRVAVGGDDRVSRYLDRSAGDAYDVELRLVGIDRSDVASISQLYVRTNPAMSVGDRLRSEIACPKMTVGR